MESVDGRPYPGHEVVVDAYLALVRDGLRSRGEGSTAAAS